jgi:ATP-dependent protease HslVU (ClpYQ) peptidase subunit
VTKAADRDGWGIYLRGEPVPFRFVTCIVGIQQGGRVVIGGDSAGVAAWSITVRADTKVFRNGEFIMGFTDSFRMGQLLRYSLVPPVPQDWDLDRFMATDFIAVVRDCLRDGGFARNDSGNESGGLFLVGIRGHLYRIDSDYQIGRSIDEYYAVGSGDEYACGSLHSTRGLDPEQRVRMALEAAAHHSTGVCPPFHIVSSDEVYAPDGTVRAQ